MGKRQEGREAMRSLYLKFGKSKEVRKQGLEAKEEWVGNECD